MFDSARCILALSLWLLPPPGPARRLQSLIDELAGYFRTPRFLPHVTLLGGLRVPEAEACAITEELAAGVRPFAITLTHLTHEPEYFRALVAEVDGGAALRDLNRRARERLPGTDTRPFRPHLSLVYGELSEDAKGALVAEHPIGLPVRFTVEALALVCTDGGVETWRVLQQTPFSGSLAP